MKRLKFEAIGCFVGAMMLVPLAPSSARADQDVDARLQERQEAIEDAREVTPERRDVRDELREERRDEWYGYYTPYDRDYGNYGYYGRPSYRYYSGRPIYGYRYYDPYVYDPYFYGYRGRVRAGPVDVFYGPRGAARVGPIRVFW